MADRAEFGNQGNNANFAIVAEHIAFLFSEKGLAIGTDGNVRRGEDGGTDLSEQGISPQAPDIGRTALLPQAA